MHRDRRKSAKGKEPQSPARPSRSREPAPAPTKAAPREASPEIRAFRRAPETKFRGHAPIVKAFDAVPYDGETPLSASPPAPPRPVAEGGRATAPGEGNGVTDPIREPKWRRRAQARPDEILDAALAAFTEQGFEATPVDDVARRAGISKAGLYLYFESKEALLRALIEREIAPFARLTRELAEKGKDSPAVTIGGIIAAMTTLFENPRMFAAPRIVLSVAPRFPEIGAYYREHVVEEALGAIASLIEAGIERGVFRKVDPVLGARAVMGPLLLHAMWTHVLGGAPSQGSPQERAGAQLDLLMQGMAS